MNPRMKTLSFALVQVFGVGVAMTVLSAPANAQTQTAQTRERIEVTGSNIKRVEGETALPVTVIGKEEIQSTGVQTAQDLLDRLSANQSFGGFTEQRGAGSTLVGFTGASLRGFGYQRTLVLLNGKRIAPYALSGGQGVDLSAIPVAAIERIEILRDGASAVYGTDAIAGVINFILRKDFRGIEASATLLDTEHGGGKNTRYNASVGAGDLARDRWNVYFTADYLKQDALKASARAISHTAYIPELGVDRTSGNSVPANITQPGGFSGTRNPTIPVAGADANSCFPPFSFPTAGSPRQCRFDFASTINTIPEFTKENYIGKGTFQISPDHQAYIEGSYYKGKFNYIVSPTPVSSGFTITHMTLPPTSAFYPTAYVAALPGGNTSLPLELSYRTVELGGRADEAKVSQSRVVAGLQGTFRTWDYSTAFNWTENKQTDTYVGGYISEARFGPLLRSGVVNPFTLSNSPSVFQQMQATQILGDASVNKAKNYGWDGKISNEIMQLPAGPLAFAFGLDWRKESLQQTNSDFLSSGDIIGGAGAIPSLPEVTRKVGAAFVEFNIPILRNLEGNVAVRYDNYSDFGNTTNPKFTLRYTPTRELLLRAAYGTGFRAPTLSDLYQPPLLTNTAGSWDDPLRCPVTHSVFDCNLQFNAQQGGNAALQPEKSHQWYLGGVWEPNAQFSAGVDYFRIHVKNLIATIDDNTIFNDFERWAPTQIVRRPPDAQNPNLPGQIAFVLENTVNVGAQETSGIDVDLAYRAPPTAWGRFVARMNGTYVLHWKQTTFDATDYPDFVGQRGQTGAITRWRHYLSLDWTSGPWGATAVQWFQNGYSEPDAITGGNRRVGTYEIYDLQGRFTGWKYVRIEAGVRNIFDRAPPVSNQNANFQVGYDPQYGDPRGRMYYATIRLQWK